MRLSTKGEYALRAILDINKYSKDSGVTKVEDIAARQNISNSYLEQIFRKLKRAGIVVAFKGPGGGYSLGKKLGEITVKEVLEAVGDNLTCVPNSTESESPEAKTIKTLLMNIDASTDRILKLKLSQI